MMIKTAQRFIDFIKCNATFPAWLLAFVYIGARWVYFEDYPKPDQQNRWVEVVIVLGLIIFAPAHWITSWWQRKTAQRQREEEIKHEQNDIRFWRWVVEDAQRRLEALRQSAKEGKMSIDEARDLGRGFALAIRTSAERRKMTGDHRGADAPQVTTRKPPHIGARQNAPRPPDSAL